MTDKELRKLNRVELLEMLIAQVKENDHLQTQLDEANAKLASRTIEVSKAGSIAEASLKLNGVFTAAEAAAAQYLENIKALSNQQKEVCRKMEAECKAKCDAMRQETKEYCEKEKRAVREYLDTICKCMPSFDEEHQNLHELLTKSEG